MNEFTALILISLLFLGLCFGSFVNALVWRLHEKRDFVRERSECVHCHHELAWYDLIPVLSWVGLRGKCRYCKKPISWQYPVVEILTAVLFVGSYLVWPFVWSAFSIILFVIWLASVVMLVALLVYDFRWMLLPDKLTFPLMALSLIGGCILAYGLLNLSLAEGLLFLGFGVMSLGGVYYVLYTISRGAWVGFGDVKLGIAMGLAGGWKVGLLTLMLANVIGLLYILPGLMTGKLKRTSRVPFGPFLIIGFMIAYLFVTPIANWYLQLLF